MSIYDSKIFMKLVTYNAFNFVSAIIFGWTTFLCTPTKLYSHFKSFDIFQLVNTCWTCYLDFELYTSAKKLTKGVKSGDWGVQSIEDKSLPIHRSETFSLNNLRIFRDGVPSAAYIFDVLKLAIFQFRIV